MADDNHRHPSNYSDDELRSMLRAERTAVTRSLIVLRHEIRNRVAQVEALQRRLDDIDASEEFLGGGS